MTDQAADELRRIRELLERLVAAAEAHAREEEPVNFPLGPFLEKDRPRRGGGRGR